ncbi:MAG TPA: sugar phosphate isomerase/epimerase [Bryobacteraceae bacterium]|nr:sugar phosphate isomerase/epimerase [Bryobacteraceae bacterium]
MNLNRRDFGKLALAAAAAPTGTLLAAKPNSVFSGVQLGVITYSFRDMPEAHTSAEKMLEYIVQSGASGIEFMSDAAEAYAGSPAVAYGQQGRGPGGGGGARGGSGGGRGGAGFGGGRAQMSDEQRAAMQAQQKSRAEELKKWRLSVSMDKYKALRKMYNDAGVTIYCLKLEPNANMSDEEMDYVFTVATTLGATSVTTELSNNAAFTQRAGDFALKHGVVTAYHAHEQARIDAWDAVLAQSKGNAVNLDCGHYYAGTGQSPIPAIQKLHDRIASIHLKDRTPSAPGTPGANLPWGQGSTPIVEILQLIRDQKWKFPASVELEYQVPAGSDSVVEVRKCIEYARKALA